MTENTISFAARICCLDRFTGEPPSAFAARYEALLSRYLDVPALLGILNGDPDFAAETALIARAAEIARAQTDSSGTEHAVGKNLASVFSRLSLKDKAIDRKKFFRYDLAPFSPEAAFPKKEADPGGREGLAAAFFREMDRLAQMPPADVAAFHVCFDRICQEYLWCITATDNEGEDISLYDFLKLTEAIAVCRLRSEDAEAPYTLVMADFSGIQKYIFGISSMNHSGVAKRLRARSFYVDTVCRVLAQYVIDRFSLSRSHILLETGGKFYCMVPTTAQTEGVLRDIRTEIDRHLYESFHGAVSVNMAWLGCSDAGLEEYSTTIVKLSELLGSQKAHPFRDILHNEEGWDEGAFVLYPDLSNKKICADCGAEMISHDQDSCPTCRSQLSMGTRLPNSRFIIYRKSPAKGTYRIFQDYFIELVPRLEPDHMKDVILIEVLNQTEIPQECQSLPIIRRYMVNHIPMEKGNPLTFEEIAAKSRGVNRLAVLKADVDILGFLFAQGLRTKERHFGTISRVSTMSRMLEIFFSGYLSTILESPAYRNIYSVFSGGDDLFLIGPWDVMLGLSLAIRDKFREFTAKNPAVTMSAAVSIFHSREHISFMVDSSEGQLSRAKNELLPQVYPERRGRNAVCVMGELFSWEDFREQLASAERIRDLLILREVDVSILRRLMRYSEMYREYVLEDDIWSLMYEAYFHYDRQRNYRMNLRDEGCNWFRNGYVKSMENAADGVLNKNLYFAASTVKIALNSRRRERN